MTHYRSRAVAGLVVTAAVIFAACSGSVDDSNRLAHEAQPLKVGVDLNVGLGRPPATPEREVVVDALVPAALSLSELAIVGRDVSLGSRSKVVNRHGGFATVGNVGPDLTTLGVDVETGPIISAGSVFLHRGVHVHGGIRTGGRVPRLAALHQ